MLTDHLGWHEVLRGSGWSTVAEVPPEVRARMAWAGGAVFEPLRRAWGGPLIVVSGGGIRSPRVNDEAGGSRKSRHMAGDAFDVRPVGAFDVADLLRLYDLANRMQRSGDGSLPPGGLGLYVAVDDRPRFVHVDGRGRLARWNAAHLLRARSLVSVA